MARLGWSARNREARSSRKLRRFHRDINLDKVFGTHRSVPQSIGEALDRHKDIEYSSRIVSHITRHQQMQRLRHVISQLVRFCSDDVRKSEAVRELAGYGSVTQMHLVPLMAPRLENENFMKDIDFSTRGIGMRR